MIRLSSHRALQSRNSSLFPANNLIDGRTELDQLVFLTEFGELINFYDSENVRSSSWAPFLLKDPVFLLATISRTRIRKWHEQFEFICTDIKRALGSEIRSVSIGSSFNHLFDHLNRLYMKLEMWASYMYRSLEIYDLKIFVIDQITNRYSGLLWGILSLRQYLSLHPIIPRIEPVDYYQYESFDSHLWKNGSVKETYWEILDLSYPMELNSQAAIFKSLENAGVELYQFINTIVEKAVSGYEKLSNEVSDYPDTTLLRTCVDLLKVHRNQLNGITEKHLDFYFKDILLQNPMQAQPDSAYLSVKLASPDTCYELSANTQFLAGADASGNPILFTTAENVSLNPAQLGNVYTLTAGSTASGNCLFLEQIISPEKVNKNEAGQVQGWNTFGNSSPVNQTRQKVGFGISSPMLLLREGNRRINFTINYNEEWKDSMFADVSVFLSTQTAWLDVTSFKTIAKDQQKQEFSFYITLSPAIAPIEAFLKNPDGVESQWPMVKFEFETLSDLSEPPVITSIKLDVTVSDMKTVLLSNDNGAINPKAPFPVLGTTPQAGSRFIMGSDEIFSKPFQSVFMEFDWDKTPLDFAVYYDQYNAYIKDPVIPVTPKKPGIIGEIILVLKSIFKGILFVINYFRKKKIWPHIDEMGDVFNNISFAVDYSLLSQRNWETLTVTKIGSVTYDSADPVNIISTSYARDPGCKFLKKPDKGTQLFNTDGANCEITGSSFFEILPPDSYIPDASVQNKLTPISPASSSGFLAMTLEGPDPGFGFEMYSRVVAYVALKNAALISAQPHNKKAKLIPAPNAPFVLKAKTFSVNQYKASVTYDFNYEQSGYPVQCYHYTPFANYLIYDSTKAQDEYWTQIGTPVVGKRKLALGVSLYPSFAFTGALLIGLNQAIYPEQLSIYFELSRIAVEKNASKEISAFYLANDYWQPLPVISDKTGNLSCSGVITVQLKQDLCDTHFSMPSGSGWIAFCTGDNTDLFPNTTFLSLNGVQVTRSGTTYLSDVAMPVLPAASITGPFQPIPAISSVVQPFVSFGGRAAENSTEMVQRVSTDILTKQRAVRAGDIYQLVCQQFKEIYYTDVWVESIGGGKKRTNVLVVPGYSDPGAASAYTPLVSECLEMRIQDFLNACSPVFANLQVSNYSLQPVQVHATVSIMQGFEPKGVLKSVTSMLNLYLSPWILSDVRQVAINEPVSAAQVVSFLKTIKGVGTVTDLYFTLKTRNTTEDADKSTGLTVLVPAKGELFVSQMTHQLTIQNQ